MASDNPDDNSPKDPTVKQLLARDKPLEEVVDAVTAAELARWFSLPSFTELAEQGTPVENPDVVAARERRAKAVAAVDPVMLAAMNQRIERAATLARVHPEVTIHLDPDVLQLDLAMIEGKHTIAEERLVEISTELEDALHECTPQALLRDLHRPELEFEKTFEVIDVAREQQFDIVAVVREAMRTSWKLPVLDERGYTAARAAIAGFRSVLESPWPALFNAKKLPNRTVTE